MKYAKQWYTNRIARKTQAETRCSLLLAGQSRAVSFGRPSYERGEKNKLHKVHQGVSKVRARGQESLCYVCPGQRDSRQIWNMPATQNIELLMALAKGVWVLLRFVWVIKKDIPAYCGLYFEVLSSSKAQCHISWGYHLSCEGYFCMDIQRRVTSNNGSQFSWETFRYSHKRNISDIINTPGAVQPVKSGKKTLIKSECYLHTELYQWANRLSLAQLLMGGNLCTSLPQPSSTWHPKWLDLQ